MPHLRDRLEAQARSYAGQKGISILRFLGDGNDGAVWESSRDTAVKVLERLDSYQRELDAYLRLKDLNVSQISGVSVPVLVDRDDSLQVVEMTNSIRLSASDWPRPH